MIRGHLKILVLKALEEGEKTGYGLMKYLEEKIGSKPSSGSMYPILETLKREELIKLKQEGKKKLYTLTAKGKTAAKEMGAQREEIVERFLEGFKMMQAITGEDVSTCEAIVQNLKRGEMPLKHLNPELTKFRELMIKMYQKGNKKEIQEIRKILREATQKMRKL